MSLKQAPMTKKQVKQIARHFLGSKLVSVTSDAYGEHTIFIRCGNAFFKARDRAALIRECERWHKMFVETGWKPTHPRLEWVPYTGQQFMMLELHVKNARFRLLQADRRCVVGPKYEVSFFTPSGVSPHLSMDYMPPEEAVAAISTWVETHLPYYLPDLPTWV